MKDSPTEKLNVIRENKIAAVDLERMARSISKSYGDKGAIVLSVGEEGVRIGVHGLDDREIQDALCVGIHYNFVTMEQRS